MPRGSRRRARARGLQVVLREALETATVGSGSPHQPVSQPAIDVFADQVVGFHHRPLIEVAAPARAAQPRGPRFVADSPLEGRGFEPSPLFPKSSVSAALAPSVAANLHPYTAPFCTPASTE